MRKNYGYRYKPSKAAVEQWLLDVENFKIDCDKLGKELGILIITNEKGNSVYFRNRDDVKFRISTHHSELAEEKRANGEVAWNGSGFELPEKNLVTNSRKNILKLIRENY